MDYHTKQTEEPTGEQADARKITFSHLMTSLWERRAEIELAAKSRAAAFQKLPKDSQRKALEGIATDYMLAGAFAKLAIERGERGDAPTADGVARYMAGFAADIDIFFPKA